MATLKELYKKEIQNRTFYEVPSKSNPGWHWNVIKKDGVWTCDCPGWRSHKKPCRHIWSVLKNLYD